MAMEQPRLLVTPTEEIEEVITRLRRTLIDVNTLDYNYRRTQLLALKQLLIDNKEEFNQSFCMGCGFKETGAADLFTFVTNLSKLEEALHMLAEITAPSVLCRADPLWAMSKTTVIPYPKGVALLLGTWNFPSILVFRGLVSAIATGCPCIIKPTERNPHFSNLMARLIPQYLDQNLVQVVAGGVETAQELLKHKFGVCYFVGSPAIARHITRACAETFTPCIIEAGGINPAIVDGTADIKNCAKRVCWGASVNAGQFCLRPQYSLCIGQATFEKHRDAMVEVCKNKFHQYRFKCVDSRHFEQCYRFVQQSIDQGAELICGDLDMWDKETCETKLIIATLDKSLMNDNIVMQEEIFGNYHVIIKIDSVDEAIELVNHPLREEPLSMNIFSNDRKTVERLNRCIRSGSTNVNMCCTSVGRFGTDSGGVGRSGWSHDGYKAFQHMKHVFEFSDGFLAEESMGLTLYDQPSWVLNLVPSILPFDAKFRSTSSMTMLSVLVAFILLIAYYSGCLSCGKDLFQ